ncbi:hypothetical protein GUJ93_ZPchr0452g16390 [Zizania palustris]|uniref:Uncharacterized protein n=1 Tax=Zizania palustris TaxID=103762 RepID=A0A8J5R2H5_ZIZPA|nr:hypothetical protein GUJ93_ZPchr0452g16390 [Zizania palustris]
MASSSSAGRQRRWRDSSTAPASPTTACSVTPSRPSSATSSLWHRPSPPPLTTLSSLLGSPHPAVYAHAAASSVRLAASRADLAFPFLIAPLSALPSPRLASCFVKAIAALVCRSYHMDCCISTSRTQIEVLISYYLSVSACIERRNSVVQALGLESLSYLCEVDVVAMYSVETGSNEC